MEIPTACQMYNAHRKYMAAYTSMNTWHFPNRAFPFTQAQISTACSPQLMLTILSSNLLSWQKQLMQEQKQVSLTPTSKAPWAGQPNKKQNKEWKLWRSALSIRRKGKPQSTIRWLDCSQLQPTTVMGNQPDHLHSIPLLLQWMDPLPPYYPRHLDASSTTAFLPGTAMHWTKNE